MEKVCWHLVEQTKDNLDVTLITPKPAKSTAPTGVTLSTVPGRPIWLFLLCSLTKSLYFARKNKVDVFMAASGLTAPAAWLASKLSKSTSVVYLHGTDIETPHRLYRFAWVPFIRRCDRIITNSNYTKKSAIAAGVSPGKICVAPPGTDKGDLSSYEKEYRRFRTDNHLKDAPLILYLGRITERKGLPFFVHKIFPLIKNKHPTAHLIVIGNVAHSAIAKHDGSSVKMRNFIDLIKNRDDITFLGAKTENDKIIRSALIGCDVHIFPVQKSKQGNEGFGLVNCEAAAHGTPTVAFDVGGVGDSVKEGKSGFLVREGETKEFAEKVSLILKNRTPLPCPTCIAHSGKMSWSEFGHHLRNALQVTPDHEE